MVSKGVYVILLGSAGAKGYQVSIDESAEEKKMSTLVLIDIQRFLMGKRIPYYIDYPNSDSVGFAIDCILRRRTVERIIVVCSSSHVCDIKECVAHQESVEIWSFDGSIHRNPSIIPRHLHFANVYPQQEFLRNNGISHLLNEIDRVTELNGYKLSCLDQENF